MNRAAEHREVPRGRDLLGVGEAGSVLECGAAHADGAGLAGHHLREGLLIAADRLRDDDSDVIRRLGDEGEDRVLDGDRVARVEADLRGGLARGEGGNRQLGVEPQLAALQLLEEHVERHHLGDRGREARRVGVSRLQNAAGVHIDDDGGVGRGVSTAAALAGLRFLRRREEKGRSQNQRETSGDEAPNASIRNHERNLLP